MVNHRATRVPDLGQLHALVVTAGAGSMSAAAELLGVTQQAVSGRIRASEATLGVAVFDRSTRGVVLTSAGQLVVTWARDVLNAAESLDDGVRALRSEGDTVVHVAASNTISECLLPRWASQLRGQQAQARVQVRPGNSEMVLGLVAAGEVSLGYVEGPRVPRTLRSKVVARDHLVVVVAPDHRWARLPRGICRDELARTPLVVREAGSGTRLRLLEAVPDLVEPELVLSSTGAVRDAVVTSGCPAVLSSLAVRQDVGGGRLVEVPVRDLSIPRLLRAVWHPSQRPQGAAADLLRISATDGAGRS